MSLYRQDSTGFLCEFATSPGAGYTAVSAMPGDLTGRVNWWRLRDVDTALGQSTDWHPSIQQAAENPFPVIPDLRAGSGVNVAAYRYSVFTESALPPLSSSSATPTQVAAGFYSAKCLRVQATAANGYTVLANNGSNYNIKLTPNRKWIISVMAAAATSGAKQFYINVKTSPGGDHFLGPFTTGATANAFSNFYAALDLSADSSTKAWMAPIIVTSGTAVLFDGFMMEELIGPNVIPSAFSAPDPVVDGSQVAPSSLADTSLISISGSTVSITNLNATNLTVGTINGSRFGSDTIGSGPIISGVLHRQYGNVSAPSFPFNTATTIQAGSYASGAVTIPANADRSAVVIIMCVGNPTVSATQSGHILMQLARGTSSTLLSGSIAIVMFSPWSAGTNQTNGFVTQVFYEPVATTGTGILNYYLRGHQCFKAGSQAVQTNWLIMEFSK